MPVSISEGVACKQWYIPAQVQQQIIRKSQKHSSTNETIASCKFCFKEVDIDKMSEAAGSKMGLVPTFLCAAVTYLSVQKNV